MRSFRFILLFLICTLFLNAKELRKVTLQLSWFDQFQFAGYYIAKNKGFYEKLGLDVEIRPFEFGLDTPNDVSKGKIDFAIGRETLILDRIKGEKIVALMAIFQASPLVLVSTKESGINKIEDFKDKTIMTTIDDAGEVSLKAMIRSHNIKIHDLDFLKHTHNIQDLINKKTDVISAYISKSPYELQQLNIPYNIFAPRDYGFDMYSDFLFTSEKLLSSDTELIKAFKKASLLGWEYAYSNIDESVDLIFNSYNSQKLSKEALKYEAQELKKLSYFNNKNLGQIESSKVQRIYDLYNIMGLVKNKIKIEDFIHLNDEYELSLSLNQLEFLKKNKSFKYCAVPDAFPYSAIENGKFIGLSSEILADIKKKLKVEFTLVETNSLSQSLEYLKTKKCDFIPSLDINEKRKSYLGFSSSYIDVPLVFITQNSVAFIDDIKSLKNKRIAVIKGFYLFDEIQKKYPNVEFIEVNTSKEAFSLIEKGDLFAFISSFTIAWNQLKDGYITKLKISGKLSEELNLRFAIHKDEMILKEVLSLAILELDKKHIDSIQNKWLYSSVEEKFDYTLLFQILVVIFIVFMLLLYRQKLLKELNKNLNKKVEEKTKELQKINEGLEIKISGSIEEIRQKDKQLERQVKLESLTEILENLAHQWRQPLSVITTAASGIKLKKDFNSLDDGFLYEHLELILKSSASLSKTIDELSFLFNPSKEKQRFFISDSINKTLNFLEMKFRKFEIEIEKDLEDIEIDNYETEFVQVLISIFNNSMDAFEERHVLNKLIKIKLIKNKDSYQIDIYDNAGGIKAEYINRIFEPYFTTKHKSNGTGLSLYMSEQILSKYMNGKIEFKNSKLEYKEKTYDAALFSIYLFKDGQKDV